MRTISPLNLANQLTLLRLALVPAFAILTLYGELGWALIVFVVAGITDGLDGLIARVTNQRTTVGAWLDPMADKLLLLTTFIVLSLPGIGLTNKLPLWLTVLIISRDLVIVLTVAVITLALGPRTFTPSIYGKAATATYIVTAIVVMLFNYLKQTSVLVDVGIYASLVLTLLSGAHYVVHVRRIINEPPPLS
ncbi:MAG: CDP-alcohol phosphatidyltransferase family protein [Acidobacteria bacterium]|nr:CDP-alcohol phosphatidyltransferase family protein [Acidobacteriota bacterium]